MRAKKGCTLLVMFSTGCLVGCNQQTYYSVELRTAEDHAPVPGARVTLVSVPRIYSFLDIRHYGGHSGDREVSEGSTDAGGQVILALPTDLDVDHVVVDDAWVLRRPTAEWALMRRSAAEGKNPSPGTPGNVEIRVAECLEKE